jgi:tetratricopeptide (TPR) repeat protein
MNMKKVTFSVFTAVLLMVSVLSVYGQEMNPEAAKLYNAGNEKLKAGNYGAAITHYEDALKIQTDYRILYQKGMAQRKSGKLQEAKNSFEECIKLKSDFDGSYNALGGVLFSMGSLNEAISNFEKVLQISTNNSTKNTVKKNLAKAYAKLGTNEISSGNSSKAIEYLTKSVGYDNYDAAYLSLAKLYSETGNYDKSLTACESAMKYRSSISKGGPYYYMGIAYKFKGDTQKAKEMFNNAKVDPQYRKTAEYELTLLQ